MLECECVSVWYMVLMVVCMMMCGGVLVVWVYCCLVLCFIVSVGELLNL